MTSVHFSSKTDEWATPQEFFDRVNDEFGPFDLDPCALPSSAKAPAFYTPEQDGLVQPWFGKVWMNPPYGRAIGKWVARAFEFTRERERERERESWWLFSLLARIRSGGTSTSCVPMKSVS